MLHHGREKGKRHQKGEHNYIEARYHWAKQLLFRLGAAPVSRKIVGIILHVDVITRPAERLPDYAPRLLPHK